jgi:hypothetical protein
MWSPTIVLTRPNMLDFAEQTGPNMLDFAEQTGSRGVLMLVWLFPQIDQSELLHY